MSNVQFRGGTVVFQILLILLLPGCGKPPSQPGTEKADAAVEKFLDAWVRGESSDRFTGTGQPIQAADPDWKAGYRLSNFLGVESKPVQDKPGQVRCRVTLSLQAPGGKKVDKEVSYDVTVGESIVIERSRPK